MFGIHVVRWERAQSFNFLTMLYHYVHVHIMQPVTIIMLLCSDSHKKAWPPPTAFLADILAMCGT